jgi:NUDIX domain.
MGKQGKSKRKGRQVAALPWYRGDDGALRVLLISSRDTHRPVIPKGWPMRKLPDREAAAIEAFEEAGVRGTVSTRPIGRFRYWKRLEETFRLIDVDVYGLEVAQQMIEWPEREQRAMRWFTSSDAALLIDEPELATLISTLARRLDGGKDGAKAAKKKSKKSGG